MLVDLLLASPTLHVQCVLVCVWATVWGFVSTLLTKRVLAAWIAQQTWNDRWFKLRKQALDASALRLPEDDAVALKICIERLPMFFHHVSAGSHNSVVKPTH
jgi:hypothetical protein